MVHRIGLVEVPRLFGGFCFDLAWWNTPRTVRDAENASSVDFSRKDAVRSLVRVIVILEHYVHMVLLEERNPELAYALALWTIKESVRRVSRYVVARVANSHRRRNLNQDLHPDV